MHLPERTLLEARPIFRIILRVFGRSIAGACKSPPVNRSPILRLERQR